MAQQETQKTHLFGEMDLDLTKTFTSVYKDACYIAEQCGYWVRKDNSSEAGMFLEIISNDGYQVNIYFDPENFRVKTVKKSEDDGKNWEELDLKENLFAVSAKTLIQYNKKIKYGTEKSLPLCQGMAINSLVKKYNIPMIQWGFHYNLIGIETNKQFIIHRDQGSHLEFLGLINKDNGGE